MSFQQCNIQPPATSVTLTGGTQPIYVCSGTAGTYFQVQLFAADGTTPLSNVQTVYVIP
ncbi:hypothetical protein [Thermorudis peleae]|uniref:hypothetical protein n=1 Tax=Thermorudis peleae TaxID=1382356 RepID=UPI0012DFEA19|nr:hypothetical protein [Thermorudis peleae]